MDNMLGHEEVDSLMDIIMTIMFMTFCALAIGYMVIVMSGISQHYHGQDKLEIDADAASEMDPMYFTGFQTYMFAYMMDAYSDQPLTWLGGNDWPVSARIDGSDNKHVTICALDENGDVRPNFMSWRNQIITGGIASGQNGRDVKSVIKSSLAVPAYQIYNGTATRTINGSTKQLRFHLELTDQYINNYENVYSNMGHVLTERRKVYQWVLVPSYP